MGRIQGTDPGTFNLTIFCIIVLFLYSNNSVRSTYVSPLELSLSLYPEYTVELFLVT